MNDTNNDVAVNNTKGAWTEPTLVELSLALDTNAGALNMGDVGGSS